MAGRHLVLVDVGVPRRDDFSSAKAAFGCDAGDDVIHRRNVSVWYNATARKAVLHRWCVRAGYFADLDFRAKTAIIGWQKRFDRFVCSFYWIDFIVLLASIEGRAHHDALGIHGGFGQLLLVHRVRATGSQGEVIQKSYFTLGIVAAVLGVYGHAISERTGQPAARGSKRRGESGGDSTQRAEAAGMGHASFLFSFALYVVFP